MFWEVLVPVIKKKGPYEHVSNSQWLSRYSLLNLQIPRHCE